MPGFIGPQLATLKMKAPSGSRWINEVKYDGYRIQLRIDGDDRQAYTRNGYIGSASFRGLPPPSKSTVRPSSTANSSSSTKAAPIFPNCRQTSAEAIRTA